MAHALIHEEIFRGEEALQKLAAPTIAICGAGALGSHLADNLLRQGVRKMIVVDDDRIEEHNVGTQIYGVADVGARKVDVLRAQLYRATSQEIDVISKRLDSRNAKKLLRGADIVVDTFDNSASRRIVQDHCREREVECLHVGLNADYCEVLWDTGYRVPQDVDGDVCEYPLARNLVILAVAIASESIVRFIANEERVNLTMTLGDFNVCTPEMRVAS